MSSDESNDLEIVRPADRIDDAEIRDEYIRLYDIFQELYKEFTAGSLRVRKYTDLHELRTENEKLQEVGGMRKQRIKDLQHEVKMKDATIKELRTQNDKLVETKQKLSNNITVLDECKNQKISDLINEVKEKDAKIERLEKEIKDEAAAASTAEIQYLKAQLSKAMDALALNRKGLGTAYAAASNAATTTDNDGLLGIEFTNENSDEILAASTTAADSPRKRAASNEGHPTHKRSRIELAFSSSSEEEEEEEEAANVLDEVKLLKEMISELKVDGIQGLKEMINGLIATLTKSSTDPTTSSLPSQPGTRPEGSEELKDGRSERPGEDRRERNVPGTRPEGSEELEDGRSERPGEDRRERNGDVSSPKVYTAEGIAMKEGEYGVLCKWDGKVKRFNESTITKKGKTLQDLQWDPDYERFVDLEWSRVPEWFRRTGAYPVLLKWYRNHEKEDPNKAIPPLFQQQNWLEREK